MTVGTLVPRRTRLATPPLRYADRLFDEFWKTPFPSVFVGESRARRARVAPRIDVSETEDAYLVTAELPGLEPGHFEVAVEDGVLILRASEREVASDGGESEEGEGEARRVETRFGSFERRLRFGELIVEDAVEARYRNGLLTVTLPKPAEAVPQLRTIPVQSAD